MYEIGGYIISEKNFLFHLIYFVCFAKVLIIIMMNFIKEKKEVSDSWNCCITFVMQFYAENGTVW